MHPAKMSVSLGLSKILTSTIRKMIFWCLKCGNTHMSLEWFVVRHDELLVTNRTLFLSLRLVDVWHVRLEVDFPVEFFLAYIALIIAQYVFEHLCILERLPNLIMHGNVVQHPVPCARLIFTWKWTLHPSIFSIYSCPKAQFQWFWCGRISMWMNQFAWGGSWGSEIIHTWSHGLVK